LGATGEFPFPFGEGSANREFGKGSTWERGFNLKISPKKGVKTGGKTL